MKIRNDFVSNSSSCSFIIHVSDEADLEQLKKPNSVELLKKYACEMSKNYNDLPYLAYSNFKSIEDVEVGDFIRIYIGEDSGFDWDYSYPSDDLFDIFNKLNANYGKLKHYIDTDAHVTIGDEFEDK